MQNPIKIVFEKPNILSEQLKILTSFSYQKSWIFFYWNFAHVSHLPISTKWCSGFYVSCLDLALFAKIKKRPVFYKYTETRFFIFITNSRSKQNIKIRNTLLYTLLSMVVGAPQSFQFFRQITWFLENNGALSKFLHEILYCLINF